MSTLVHADGGEVRVAGHDVARDPAAVRAAIGVTGQFSAVDNLLTGEENLLLMADLHHLGRAEGRRRAAGLLGKFDLADAARKTAATYSGGMRRRLDLAMTLIGDPRIIFLDEPTTGLDPRSRRMMWQTIRELVAGGVTIFLTTQQLDEADELADRIALLDHGKVVAAGSPEELKRSIPGAHVRLRFADAAGLDAAARALGGAFRHEDGADAGGSQRRRRDRGAGAAQPARRHGGRGRRACPCTRPISMTCSSPSPATRRQKRLRRNGERPMTTMAFAVRDSATMTRRGLRHVLRYPVTLVMSVAVPVLLLLLFVGVFGGALKSGLGAVSHGAYIDYVMPGIIVMTAAYGSSVTAQSVNRDSTEGIIARFRTMAISPASVLNGHVASALARTLVSVALVIGVAIGLGFRPTADAGRWLAAAGVTALLCSRSPGWPSRSAWRQDRRGPVRLHPRRSAAAVHQQRVRAAGPMSGSACAGSRRTSRSRRSSNPARAADGRAGRRQRLAAVAWCGGLALAGYLWARVLFRRDLSR